MTASWKNAAAKKAAPRSAPPASEPRKTKVDANATREEKYIIAAFDAEVELVRTASAGDRNNQLNRSAFALGRYVGGGVLVEAHVVDALRVAARQAGLCDSEIDPTLFSGLTSGKLDPRTVPEPKTKPNAQNDTRNSEPEEATSEPPAYEQWGPDTAPPPLEEPTAAEPLRGLEYLGKVALVGRDRILELASTPVEYVWMDIAVAGTIVLIAGPPAEGKTTLLFLILAARMNPGEVVTLLGRAIQPAPPGQWVVLIEGEHSEASTGRKLVKSLKLLGLDDAALDRVVIVARKAVRLGSPEWTDVVRMVRAGLVSDIAIDTVARVAPADADNEREQVAVFDAVAQAIEAGPESGPKPIVWAVAHTRKNNTNGELADVSGSAQRTGQADTVLLIKGEKVD
ncbi:MAG TPA: AAA family ATPase, partial [Polyangiaceae bacterium]